MAGENVFTASRRALEGDTPPARRPLTSYQDVRLYTRIASEAALAVEVLDEAWKRPVRHNRRLEREALGYVQGVERERRRTCSDYGDLVHALPIPDPVLRYEAEAALRSFPHLLPFTPIEQERLLAEQIDVRPDKYEPNLGSDLVQRWHAWLWQGGPERQRGEVPSVEALVLRTGCEHLVRGLGSLLSWEVQGASVTDPGHAIGR